MRYRVTVRDAARAFGILTVVAGVAAAQGPTPDQLKCEQGASLAIAKFVTTKTKCLIRCEQGARKGTNPATDCSPPYAGATATCVQSAESKAALQEQSKCKKGCPSCYTGGDCVADSTARVQTAETQLDALGPIVFCNDSASPDGLNPFEAKCEDTVAKTLSTFAAAKLKCYSKCQSDLAKGKTTGTCTPPATDTKTAACISKAESKAQLLIDKQCNPAVNAKADPPECYGTNTGSTFVAIAEGGVDGGQASLYCATTATSTTSTTAVTTTSTTTTSTTAVTTTSTTTTSTTTTSTTVVTTTSTSTTSTTIGSPPLSFIDFTTTAGTGACGATFDTVSGGTPHATLGCGGLDLGGGKSMVHESLVPDGATSRMAVVGCNGTSCTVGPASSTPPLIDCTDTGCFFGPPLGIPNGGNTTCIVNTLAAPVSGTVDIAAGTTTNLSLSLSSQTFLTGIPSQPCPICTVSGTPSPTNPLTGTCSRGARSGLPCTTTSSSKVSHDCLPGGTDNSQNLGAIPVTLGPLSTGTVTASSATGIFCPSADPNKNQTTAQQGCFFVGGQTCQRIEETGAPAGSLQTTGVAKPVTLGGIFCVPKTGTFIIDFTANLPGPGAVSLVGTLTSQP